jgi:hypothetical protein
VHPQEYFLPADVYVCTHGQYCVFLDLGRDKYICVKRDDFGCIAPSFLEADFPATSSNTNAVELANELVAAGLLTTTDIKSLVSVRHAMPVRRLLDARNATRAHINALIIGRFFAACFRANRLLLKAPLIDVVHRVRQSRSRNHQARPDKRQLRALVTAFNCLRPFYPRNYLCVFDSLALLEFLRAYRVFPTWVFGVQAEPFNAHCWVQQDDVVLNETVEFARMFVPVMTV